MPDRDFDAPIELRVSRLLWRVEALERSAKELRELCGGLREDVDGIALEEKVAAGVRLALNKRTEQMANATARKVSETGGPIVLTFWQKLGGSIAGALLLLDAVRGLLS